MKTTDQKLHDLIQSRATHIKHGEDNDLVMITTNEQTEIYIFGEFKDKNDMEEFKVEAQDIIFEGVEDQG